MNGKATWLRSIWIRCGFILLLIGAGGLAGWQLAEFTKADSFFRSPSAEERRASLAEVLDLKIGGVALGDYLKARCHILLNTPAGATDLYNTVDGGFVLKSNGMGTCAQISADGYLLTAAHCLQNGGQPIIVFQDQGRVPRKARLVWKAQAPADLALLKCEEDQKCGWPCKEAAGCTAEADAPFFPLGSPKYMQKGTPLVSAGAMSTREIHSTAGTEKIDIDVAAGRLLQIETVTEQPEISRLASDVPLVPGNSGGPIIGINGQLLAISVGGNPIHKGWWASRIRGQRIGIGHAVSPAFIMHMIEEDRYHHPSPSGINKAPDTD
ncbi:MAG: serine protease [Verrucomicrobiota bacterium]